MKKIQLVLLQSFLKLILNVIFLTCHWNIQNKGRFDTAVKNNRPILLCFWHCNLLCVARYFKKTKLNLYGVSSDHFDSEILAGVLKSWKIKLIRGSSTRGWMNVIKKMVTLFKNSTTIIALTNDGPKGPRHIAKEGSLAVAKKCGVQIMVISTQTNKKWTLGTWDKTIIPKPFSTLDVNFSDVYQDEDNIDSENITQFINENS